MKLKILYEDENVLVIDKPAGIIVFPEGKIKTTTHPPPSRGRAPKTLIDLLIKRLPDLKNVGKPPRYGIVHRLDKDTSGILLVAKNNKSLNFLQKQFKERKVTKKYLALAVGKVKPNQGKIETLIGRSSKNRLKQRVYLPFEPLAKRKKLRKAITEYEVLRKFENFALLEVTPKTGRKHQIRCHLSYIHHPIAGDKLYGFKNQPKPTGLNRQFLHANFLRIKLPDGKEKEFKSALPEDLNKVLEKLNYDH